MESIERQITKEIQSADWKSIFFTEDFMDYGTPDAVRIALFRLVNKNFITRLARGIYVKPGYSTILDKETVPNVEAIVKAIAQRDRAKIIPTGVYALNALGLSTQVPMNFVFLTDGTPRRLKIGKATIKFKRTVPKNLNFSNELCMLVVQALKEIGNGKVNVKEKEKVKELLKQVEYKELKHDIALAPQWIAEIMAKAIP
jgi:hypothetical protein